MRLIILIAILLCSSTLSFSQDQNVFFSEPVDVSLEGWNKLLLLKNGNTMLFHFQNRKGIVVKVYDKDHKEIASQKHLCNLLDINALDRTNFSGLCEVNNEGVLFVTMDLNNHKTLLRLRFEGNTAKLLAEDKVIEATSEVKYVSPYILYNADSCTYSILCYQRKSWTDQNMELRLKKYSADHSVRKESSCSIGINDWYVSLIGGGYNKTGSMLIVVKISKPIDNSGLYDEFLKILYLQNNSDTFLTNDFKLQGGFTPYGAEYLYNSFARKHNIYLASLNEGKITNGNHSIDVMLSNYTMFLTDDDFTSPQLIAMNDDKINEFAKSHSYPKVYTGSLLAINTNERGLTTVISENEFSLHKTDNKDLSINNGDFGITQLDDDGKEIWGTLLPRSRYYKLAVAKDVSTPVFGTLSQYGLYVESVYQLKNNAYILFNELEKNFNKSIADTLIPISDFATTQSVYYQINRKREVTKKYLFGQPQEGIYQQAYFNSDDIDEKTGNYAVMFLRRKGKDVTTHIAWLHFDI